MLLRKVAGLHAVDRPDPFLPRGRKRALRVDGVTCVIDHCRRESQLARIERSSCDTEIRRQPADVQVIDAMLSQLLSPLR